MLLIHNSMLDLTFWYLFCGACSCLVGYLILDRLIFDNIEITSLLPKVMFVITFALSTQSLLLVIFQIYNIADQNSRQTLWHGNIYVLMCLSIFALPSLGILKLLSLLGLRNTPIKIVFAVFWNGWCSYMLFRQEGPMISCMAQLLMPVGIVIIAVLSGYGSVNCPIEYWNVFVQDIQTVRKRKKELTQKLDLTMTYILKARQKSKEVVSSKSRQEAVLSEINSLQSIKKDFFQSFVAYDKEEEKYNFSLTYQGFFYKKLSLILAVYCLYKVIMTVKNIVFGRNALSYDPFTRIQMLLVCLYDEQVVSEVIAAISFIFMGYVMFSNVRSFTMNIIKVLQIFTRHNMILNRRTQFVLYLLSQAYGVYFICALLMLQTSLPRHYISGLQQILQRRQLVEAHLLAFDKWFLLASVFSLLVIGMMEHWRITTVKDMMKKGVV